MKHFYWLLLLIGSISSSFAQELRAASKTNFSDFPKESKKIIKYKMLEIRYIVVDNDQVLDSVTVNTEKYKLFSNRNLAIEFYYAIRHIANKKEVYYVRSTEEKNTEYFPFEEK